MLPILLILSLLLAIILAVVFWPEHSRYIRYVALVGSLASLALLPLVQYGSYALTWFGSSSLFSIAFSISAINLLLLFIILLIGPIVILYSFGFIDTPSQQKRFYIELLGFEAAMIVFAISANFLTLFIAWEFLSLMSYLLIGFWDEKRRPAQAARKAITNVFIGDVALLGAIAIFASAFGTLSFAALTGLVMNNLPAAFVAGALLLVAVFAKSGQFPFQEWLPDAMEGPAPVSAFLHSATMVKAGVFLVVLMLPFFQSAHLTPVIEAISIITIALSTMNALKSTHVKRILAYSTMQELGLMLFAISSGAILAGLYFFLVQTFYKALLFLSSGAVMRASGEEDIRNASGLTQNKLLYISTLFGVFSIVGFIPFAGFFSNYVVGLSLSGNLMVYIGLNIVGVLTSFFVFRWLFLISKKAGKGPVAINYDSLPRSMVAAVAILGVASLAVSLSFIYFPGFILSGQPQYPIQNQAFVLGYFDTALILLPAIAGAAVSYAAYKKKLLVKSRIVGAIFSNSLIFNRLYAFFARLVLGLAAGFSRLDGYLDSGAEHLGSLTYDAYSLSRGLSTGSINRYAFAVAIGAVVILVAVYLLK